MSLSKEKVHFYNLDIIRLLAALAVVVAHAYAAWTGYYGQPEWLQGATETEPNAVGACISRFVANFNLGVDTFFLISGFLITYLLLIEKQEKNKIDIGKFYMRRALRIMPLYYMSILVAPLLVFIFHRTQPDYLANILLVNNFNTIKTQTWDFPFAHFWSICIEEHFYLIWPWLIAFIPMRRLPALFAVMILISIGYRGYANLAYSQSYFQLYLHTLSRIDVMVIGGALAYAHFSNPFKLRFPLLVRMSVYGVFVLLLFAEANNNWDSLFMAMVKKYFYIAVISFEMMNYLFNENALFNFKKKNVLHYLGKTSYGIYMFGNMLIPFVMAIENELAATVFHNVFTFLALNLIVTCIAAALSYELFEKYFLSFKKRFEIIKTER